MDMKKFACLTGAAAVAISLFADSNAVTNSFESEALDAKLWGDGTVASGGPAAAPAVGYPVASGTAHTKILEVAGTVSNTLSWAGADTAQVDMMVRISCPEDELESLTGAAAAAQIAIGVQTNGSLCIWAKDRGAGSASWLEVCPSNFVDDTWLRLAVNFNYAAGKCQLFVDGQPCVSAHGYLTATSDAATPGSWYTLANAPASDKSISLVSISGAVGLDDFVAQKDVTAVGEAAFPVDDSLTVTAAGGIPVKVSYLNKYGLAWDSTGSAAPDGSGMTVEKKYLLGLDPTDGSKFEMQDMGFETKNDVEYVTISIPGELADTANYTYAIETANNPSFTSSASTAVTAEGGKVSKEIPAAAGVTYYKVKVTSKPAP